MRGLRGGRARRLLSGSRRWRRGLSLGGWSEGDFLAPLVWLSVREVYGVGVRVPFGEMDGTVFLILILVLGG